MTEVIVNLKVKLTLSIKDRFLDGDEVDKEMVIDDIINDIDYNFDIAAHQSEMGSIDNMEIEEVEIKFPNS